MSPVRERWRRIARAHRKALHIVGRSLAVLLGLAFLTAASTIVLLTQTVVGREVAASFVQRALSGAVHGKVAIGPILGGNLLTRARLERLEITTSDGGPFLSLRGIRLEYNPVGLLLGSYRFRHVHVDHARLLLAQDEQGTWNFRRLFPGGGGGPRPRILLTDVSIGDGRFEVHTPWASDLQGAARRRSIARALAGNTIWRVRRSGPGRYERVMALDSLSGRFSRLRIADPDRPTRFDMEDIRTIARIVSQPLDIRRFDGSAIFRDSIRVHIARLKSPVTSLSGEGWVVPGQPLAYRFDVHAEPLGFEDLQWLPIPIPTHGGGPLDLGLRSRGRLVVVDIAHGDVRVDDSRMLGSFTVALETPPRFDRLDVELRPLRMPLVDALLARPPTIDGFLRGRITGSGPIDLVRIDAELRVRDPDGDVAPSAVHARGGMSIGEPHEMRGLQLEFRDFEPRWTAVVGIPVGVGGRVNGRVSLDGFVGGRVNFSADLRHRLPGDTLTHVVGGGLLDVRGNRTLNLSFTADPISLSLLDPLVPGVDLVGVVRGPISASGELSDLRVVTDLRTQRGLLNFDGRFDLVSERRRYDARLTARGIQLRQWVRDGPFTELGVRGRVRGVGTDPATLAAEFDLTILPSLFEGARVDSSLLRFTVRDGLALADTFVIRTDVGTVRGRGAFGLSETAQGAFVLDAEAPDMSTWNRWLIPGRNVSRADTSVTDLFSGFARGAPDRSEERAAGGAASRDTLAGSLVALGVVSGNFSRLRFGGRLRARRASFGKLSADSLVATLDLSDTRARDTLVLLSNLWNLRTPAGAADSTYVRLERRGPDGSRIDLRLRRDTSLEAVAHASMRTVAGETELSIDRLDLALGSRSLALDSAVRVTVGDSLFEVRGLALSDGHGGRIGIDGAVPRQGRAELNVEFEGLRAEDIARLGSAEGAVSGTLQGSLHLTGTAAEPRIKSEIHVRDPALGPVSFEALDANLRYAGRKLRGEVNLTDRGRRVGQVSGAVGVDLSLTDVDRRLSDNPLDLRVVADSLPLALAELSFSSLRDVEGEITGNVRVRGGAGTLRYQGRARLSRGAATLPDLGVRLGDIEGPVTFRDDSALLDTLTLTSSAGGVGIITGRLGLADLKNPEFDLGIQARGLRGLDRRLASLAIGGQGRLAGDYERPELSGRYRLSDGEIHIERFLRERQAIDLTDPAVENLIDTTLVAERRLIRRVNNPFMRHLRMSVDLSVGPDLWLRSRTLDVEVNGAMRLHLDRATGDMTATGTLTLPRGKYRYVSGSEANLSSLYSRQLQITGGTIEFVGTPGLDPSLDIAAQLRLRTDQGPLVVTVNVGGTLLSRTITTSSDPPLAESDRICYLLFSAPCLGVTSRGGEFAASLLREGILGTVGSQFSQALVSETGLVDYLSLRSSGTPDRYSGAGSSPLFADTEVELGKYIGPNLFVRANQPLGGRLPGASLEWHFSGNWTLEARTEDRFQRFFAFSSVSNIDTDRTYGLFLFREWSF